MLRPTAVTGTVLAVALVLAGCSSSTADAPSASATSAPAGTSSDPSLGPSASPSGTGIDTFEILPESVLAALPDFAYVAAEGQDDQVRSQGANASVARVFSGATARQLLYAGDEVGGVQVWRFREDVPLSAKAQLLTFMVGGFGGKEAITGILNGVPVAQVEQARQSQIAAVGFLTNTDMILVWSAGTEAAQRLAVTYMAAAGVTEVVDGASGSPSPSS